MSRIGKLPIDIPQNVTLKKEGDKVMVSGPKGEVKLLLPSLVEVIIENGQVICKTNKNHANLWGLTRTLIANAVLGVSEGWTRTLELVGVGYRAQVEGDTLVLTVGFSHPVKVQAPNGISFSVSENKIQVLGADKQLVGEIAVKIRRIRPPEPYKGKGIKYQEEKIRRKLGKVAKTLGAAGGTGGK